MPNFLNITNGDCAVDIMQKAGIEGDFLPWRDVLHDGPVPKDKTLEGLSNIRAEFISSLGWGEYSQVKKGFVARDNVLKSFKDYDKVILWFEHDLYDQLQILQILDWFNQQGEHAVTLSIICTEAYLGPLTVDELIHLKRFEQPITQQHLTLASDVWSAFCESTPLALFKFLQQDLTPLPYLKDAIVRLFEEYPNHINGLSRTAVQALTLIAGGESNPYKLFALNQKQEKRVYLGDLSFWNILNDLLLAAKPLLALNKGEKLTPPFDKSIKLSITKDGLKALNGHFNYIEHNPVNRWIGGVNINNDKPWYWNGESFDTKES